MKNNNDSKLIMAIFLMNITSIACAVGAILLAINGVKGWGWFLACSILSIATYKHVDNEDDKDDKQVSID